jgi:hypothetical protein
LTGGAILRNTVGARMDRHAATRRLKHLAAGAGIRMPRMRPHMLHHTLVTRLDAGVSLRDVQIAARHADPRTTMRYDRARRNLDRHPNLGRPARPGVAGDALGLRSGGGRGWSGWCRTCRLMSSGGLCAVLACWPW